ncbi:hypothetical protein BNJ_00274 [Kaumoebavirus]|uniref:hypothetical protein n=1 Tax=Kaumoebavirus TaxID=1859492 RepID=UPI0009C2481E|nr:hypothetical protein BNJ_00274 [Kaumoebavirus]ARA72098.1 hypothetical protein BNJ_00274 [Kaumoebavirus]
MENLLNRKLTETRKLMESQLLSHDPVKELENIMKYFQDMATYHTDSDIFKEAQSHAKGCPYPPT